MTKVLVRLLFIAAFATSMSAQSKASIQGVWRLIELAITGSESSANDDVERRVASRKDPFGAFPKGTHTSLQPGLMIFTDKHYSRTTDTGAQPRPANGYGIPGKPTVEELQAQWGPFVANAGTYSVSGTTLTLHTVVAKNPRAQSEKNFTRLAIKLGGDTLWLTPIETEDGQIPNPVTSKFVRVE